MSDRRPDSSAMVVQRLLRGGLAVSLAVLTVGFVWAMASGQRISAPVRLGSLLTGGSGPDRLAAAGILVLAMTPVARVLVLIITWTRVRDWRFVVVGTFVLVVLCTAVAIGHA